MQTSCLSLPAATPPAYRSAFRRWDHASWIRSKACHDDDLAGLPFSPDVIPLAQHPEVIIHPERWRRVLAYRALAHLAFTTVLELKHVNPVCGELACGESRVRLDENQRQDAMRIYCDEGGHALFVEQLAMRMTQALDLDAALLGRPAFDVRLAALMAATEGVLPAALVRHVFVSVSETLITAILSEIPRDPRVAPAVRAVLRDHAADEACHREYFRWYFPALWRALDQAERRQVGTLLPALLDIFLAVDADLDVRILVETGFGKNTASRIWREAHGANDTAAARQRAAQPSLRMFREAGVFAVEGLTATFAAAGFTVSDAVH